MRPSYIITAAAALALSTIAATGAPILPQDRTADAASDVILVHNTCHSQIRTHGGYYPQHYHAGSNCAMVTTGGGGGGGGPSHCHANAQNHSHPGYSGWHTHNGGNCSVNPTYQNYPQQNNCVQLGTPGFSFQLCD